MARTLRQFSNILYHKGLVIQYTLYKLHIGLNVTCIRDTNLHQLKSTIPLRLNTQSNNRIIFRINTETDSKRKRCCGYVQFVHFGDHIEPLGLELYGGWIRSGKENFQNRHWNYFKFISSLNFYSFCKLYSSTYHSVLIIDNIKLIVKNHRKSAQTFNMVCYIFPHNIQLSLESYPFMNLKLLIKISKWILNTIISINYTTYCLTLKFNKGKPP